MNTTTKQNQNLGCLVSNLINGYVQTKNPYYRITYTVLTHKSSDTEFKTKTKVIEVSQSWSWSY